MLGNLTKNLNYVEREYEMAVLSSAEIDERLFVSMPDILKTPKKANLVNEKPDERQLKSPKKATSSPIATVPDNITNRSWLKEIADVF